MKSRVLALLAAAATVTEVVDAAIDDDYPSDAPPKDADPIDGGELEGEDWETLQMFATENAACDTDADCDTDDEWWCTGIRIGDAITSNCVNTSDWDDFCNGVVDGEANGVTWDETYTANKLEDEKMYCYWNGADTDAAGESLDMYDYMAFADWTSDLVSCSATTACTTGSCGTVSVGKATATGCMSMSTECATTIAIGNSKNVLTVACP